MSDYTKLTNFAIKDTLETGDPSKLILGEEIDDEFNAIAVAVATKMEADQQAIGAAFYPQSTAESAAGVVPVRFEYIWGDIRRYCTAAETNHTVAIRAAFAANDVWYAPDSSEAPAGYWDYDYLEWNVAGKTLKTDGFATKFRQRAGNTARRLFEISASNATVALEGLYVEGQIATDTGEQNHGIVIYPTGGGIIRNIQVGDVYAKNMRGDAVLVGAGTGNDVRQVTVGNVYGDNVYRNIVSIIGGRMITIGDIDGSAAGYATLDIEPSGGNVPVQGVKIGKIRGYKVSCSGVSSTNYCDHVEIESMDLDPSFTPASTPAYGGSPLPESGLILRNTKSIRIGAYKVRSMNKHGIEVIFNVGELGAESVHIGALDIALCSLTETTYNTYMLLTNVAKMTVDNIKADVTLVSATAKSCFSGGNHLTAGSLVVRNIAATLATGCILFRECGALIVENFAVTGGSFIATCKAGALTVVNGTFDGVTLCTNTDKGQWQECTLTVSSTVFTSGQDKHFLINSTLNSDYIHYGSYISDYTAPVRFGDRYVWVNPTGNKLMIKGSAPSSNSDGTVVGTQT